MEKLIMKLFLIGGLFFTGALFVSYTSADDTGGNLPQVVKAVSLEKTFTFAGEVIPTDHFDVRERLDRELLVNSYWHSSTVLHMKRAARYFPMMEKVLAENGVPDDFKYLAVAESGLDNVRSGANACGFWQFRKLAGKELELEINDEVDERYHLEKATVAACKYIKQLKKRFGTYRAAAAAYNVGPTRYAQLLRDQGQTDYFELNLNSETSRYLFRLIAIKEILSQPETYGFYLDPQDKYMPLDNYYEVQVDKSVSSWADFAKNHGMSYRELKVYNPWLRQNKLTVLKNKYQIKVIRR